MQSGGFGSVLCPACGSQVEVGRRFCGDCGARLAVACASCGATAAPSARFCGDCGASLPGAAAPSAVSAPPATAPSPVAERRLVSVLFCDLVGFTGLSEDRDPEAVRELLGRYFELCREVIGRYGGTVEKFIGDAVMAVWGVPVAHEDDAERAVRAALDLVDVIRTLEVPGRTAGMLAARAGVLTGEAAVTLGAVGQGMVAGDLVNTAARLQSVAPSGAVLVGESTRAATLGAVAYEPAGEQLLKGKAAPVPAYRALRIVAKIGGVGRTEGLEAPFVGRDEQLRLLKDLLHATARDRRMRFVSVTGQAGTGKSRLTWEFNKYIDGVVEDVFWHQGRSPAYGEGITFWALGEMVRRRAGIAEGDDPATTRARLAEALLAYVPDAADRRWIEPKLLALLGLGEVTATERDELFGAWRTFFERVSDQGVTVLVFEDIHWADQGLIDFIEHLAEWSASHPILLVTLARPDFLDRHPSWGAGRRHFVALSLDPLPDDAMEELMTGLVPGLPAAARAAILARAEGVPLYAVETVRKLLLDGRIEERQGTYHPVGDLTDLEAPPTLHALIAARLDALAPALRSLLQDASVLGQTFTVASLAAVSGQSEADLAGPLRDRIRREVLTLNRDPRSPERGQYGFVQALIREVAYGTLARRDRRTRHLAAARYFESLGEEETVGALATHYLDAFRVSEPGAEADTIAAQARIALRGAAERALALASPAQALSYLDAAREVTHDPAELAALLELSGDAAAAAGRPELARTYRQASTDAWRALGDLAGIARLATRMGIAEAFAGRAREAIAILEGALPELAPLEGTVELVALRAALARSLLFGDEYDAALRMIDEVLLAAERVDDLSVITEAVITKGTTLLYSGRFREGLVLLSGGLQLAETHGFSQSELRARLNISFLLQPDDPLAAGRMARAGLDQARRFGALEWATLLAGNLADAALTLGDWDSLLVLAGEFEVDQLRENATELVSLPMVVAALRGETPSDEGLARIHGTITETTDSQERALVLQVLAWIALAEGRYAALPQHDPTMQGEPLNRLLCYRVSVHGAVWSGDLARARTLQELIAGARIPGRWTRAIAASVDGSIAAMEGRPRDAEVAWRRASALLEAIGARLDLALLGIDRVAVAPDHAAARAAADEVRPLLRTLGAVGLERRLDDLLAARPASAPGLPAARVQTGVRQPSA